MTQPSPATESESAPLLDGDDERGEPRQRSCSSVLASKRPLSTFERALIGIAFVLLLSTAVFAGLFGAEAAKRHAERRDPAPAPAPSAPAPAPTSVPTRPPSKNDAVCLTPNCVQIAAGILSSMDQTVDPCEDFYQYANGGWLHSHPVPEDKGLFGIAQMIDGRNNQLLHDIIDAPVNKSLSEDDQVNLKHMRAFYDSCLDQDALDRTGSAPLVEITSEVVRLWRGGDGGRATKANRIGRLTDAVLFLHSRAINVFFLTELMGDTVRDPNTELIWINQPELGLPDAAYYDEREVLDIYTEVIRSSLKSVYADMDTKATWQTPWPELAKRVVAFEQRLARVLASGIDAADPNLTYNPHNTSALVELAPFLHWRDYFSGFSPRPRLPDPVIVAEPDYLRRMSAIVRDEDDETLETYLVFRSAQTYGPMLGPREPVRKEVTRLESYLSGVDAGVRADSEAACLTALINNAGFLVGRYYVQRAFSERAKTYAEDIITAAIGSFKVRLNELDWLDNSTRAVAQDKADAIVQRIGYPTSPNTTDAASIRRYHALQEPFDPTDYFGNVRRSRIAVLRRKWNNVGGKRDLGTFDMTPNEVNAYYDPPSNTINFPAGDLQSPYFDADWPEYLAFGAFGSVGAGHELSHAFDETGRLYDKAGRLTNWWTNETAARFDELRQCVIDQYADYYVTGADGQRLHVNSRRTNGEDVADLGGIAQSYRAWRDRFASDPAGARFDNFLLPGLELTRDQLFFVAFARGWARNIKPAEAVRRIRTDEHAPTWVRVLGTVSNTREFSEAFNCPLGSPMNRREKCQIW